MKRTVRSNYRLEVFPDLNMMLVSDAHKDAVARQMLRDIKAMILRHVDDVHRVVPKWDTRDECTFCHHEWEVLTDEDIADGTVNDEHSIEGEPVCCSRAIDEFRRTNKIPDVPRETPEPGND